jgi:hypothetical protein
MLRMAAELPYSVQSFSDDMQKQFGQAVASAAGVDGFRVNILSITSADATRRRLLATGLLVEFEVRVPYDSTAEAILEAMTTTRINAELEKRGLAAFTAVLEAPHIHMPPRPRACGVSRLDKTSVSALYTAYAAQDPRNLSHWQGSLKHAATVENPAAIEPIRNRTAHEEYLLTCQDNVSWVDSRGMSCSDYARSLEDSDELSYDYGQTPWDNWCTDHQALPPGFRQGRHGRVAGVLCVPGPPRGAISQRQGGAHIARAVFSRSCRRRKWPAPLLSSFTTR